MPVAACRPPVPADKIPKRGNRESIRGIERFSGGLPQAYFEAFPAGFVDGLHTHPPQGEAPRPAVRAAMEHEGPASRGTDPDAEARDAAVPHRILSLAGPEPASVLFIEP